jgi:hypothetical protein
MTTESPRVRYVKLGHGGVWEGECLGRGDPTGKSHSLRLGFWTGNPEMFDACVAQRWDEVSTLLRKHREKGANASIEDDLRQVKAVFGDDGNTVWITFCDRRMYWGRLDRTRAPEAVRGSDGEQEGSRHYLAAPGWQSHIDGAPQQPLLQDDLAGHLTMVTQYRGTICQPARPDYVLQRIRGIETPVSQQAQSQIRALESSIELMIRELTPYDFEVLVDMAFAAAGWRRQGGLGGTEEDVDLVLVRSSVGGTIDPLSGQPNVERVGVQVKSDASTNLFNKVAPKMSAYRRAIFVYHSGVVNNTAHPNVELVDAKRLAPMVLDAGLVRWLLSRVR